MRSTCLSRGLDRLVRCSSVADKIVLNGTSIKGHLRVLDTVLSKMSPTTLLEMVERGDVE